MGKWKALTACLPTHSMEMSCALWVLRASVRMALKGETAIALGNCLV